MGALAGGHALLLYFALAFAGFWTCLALAPVAPTLPFLGALSPGVAAVVVSGLSEGEAGIRALLRRLVEWRVGIQWYLAALGLPVAEGLLAIGVAIAFGSPTARRIGPFIPEMWVMYVFAACEELGWRGYALPRLLALLLYQGIDRAWTPWLRASIAIAMALTVVVLDARLRRREPSMAAA